MMDKQSQPLLKEGQQQGQQLQENEIKEDKGEEVVNQQEMPDHFYDSDLASINEKDFLSDNQPPKDLIQERKLLYKQKKLHVFKTIVRLGLTIDKPARYDKIRLKFKQVPTDEVKPFPLKRSKEAEYVHPEYFSSFYLMDTEQVSYNLGHEYLDIERLVTSMKRGETAVFELQNLQISKKSGIKLRESVEVFVIGVEEWVTVIDMDCDGKYMKEVLRRGEGHNRINKYDEVSFEYFIRRGGEVRSHQQFIDKPLKLQNQAIASLPKIVWKVLNNMKSKEMVRLELSDELFRQCEGSSDIFKEQVEESLLKWEVVLQIFSFHSIDDIFMNGELLKKILVRGVSTAKPDPSSLVYYALKFVNSQKEAIYADECFESDWWEDFGVLEKLGCRKSYLDDYSLSKMARETIFRMKPGQIGEIECRSKQMFQYGMDYEEYKQHHKVETTEPPLFLIVRIYNFTEGKNCFNMELQEKIEESKRKKAIGVRLLKEGRVGKALKMFESIVSFFGSGNLNQQAYNEKVSALMNSILCHLKNENYLDIIKLSQHILEHPKHGFDPTKLKIKGPMHAKIQGKVPQEPEGDERQDAELQQNSNIIDKCLYRKALALARLGEGEKALASLGRISSGSEQVESLRREAEKLKENYEKKSVKMYKNMFG